MSCRPLDLQVVILLGLTPTIIRCQRQPGTLPSWTCGVGSDVNPQTHNDAIIALAKDLHRDSNQCLVNGKPVCSQFFAFALKVDRKCTVTRARGMARAERFELPKGIANVKAPGKMKRRALGFWMNFIEAMAAHPSDVPLFPDAEGMESIYRVDWPSYVSTQRWGPDEIPGRTTFFEAAKVHVCICQYSLFSIVQGIGSCEAPQEAPTPEVYDM